MVRYKFAQVVFIIVLYCIILLVPILLDNNLYQRNDLDEITFSLLYIKESLFQNFTFPQWNPFANQGVPISADPLQTFFNPVVSLPLLLLPFTAAIKTTYLIVLVGAGFSMYYTCRKLKIDPTISLLLGLTFASGGYVASRIVAAHFLVLSYPFLPLFFLSIMQMLEGKHYIWSIILATCLTIMLFSADVYSLLYSSVILTAIFIYAVIQKKILYHFFLSFLLSLLLAAVKILPFIELSGYISKIQEPFAGSQNLISMLYYIFLPIKPIFHFIGLSHLITTEFAWWEKIAFIGPLPLIGLILALIYSYKKKSLLMLIFIVLILLSMPGFFLNPLHYLIKHITLLQTFHVPSRTFAMLTTLLLILSGIVISQVLRNHKKKQYYRIVILGLVINLVATTTFFISILIFKEQPPLNENFSVLLEQLREKDKSVYYIAQRYSESPILSSEAVRNKHKFLQNYALFLKNSPARQYNLYDYNEIHSYSDIQPKYLLVYRQSSSYKEHNNDIFGSYKDVFAIRNARYTPYAFVENTNGRREEIELSPTAISTNTIQLQVRSDNTQNTLTLLESYYPGWEIMIDGKKSNLLPGRFLQVRTLPGEHTYTFVFSSLLFRIGAVISMITFIILVLVIMKYWHSSIRQELAV